jgi:hypothetical protein
MSSIIIIFFTFTLPDFREPPKETIHVDRFNWRGKVKRPLSPQGQVTRGSDILHRE